MYFSDKFNLFFCKYNLTVLSLNIECIWLSEQAVHSGPVSATAWERKFISQLWRLIQSFLTHVYYVLLLCTMYLSSYFDKYTCNMLNLISGQRLNIRSAVKIVLYSDVQKRNVCINKFYICITPMWDVNLWLKISPFCQSVLRQISRTRCVRKIL